MAVRSFFLFVSLAACLSAQSPAPEPSCAQMEHDLFAQRRLLSDWAGLTQYGSENSELKLPDTENRVVFLGDEITERWGESWSKFFAGKPYINRGIARQTTPQLLVRFRQDVIELKPKVVVILAGANDLAGAAGPITENMAAENFMTMTELAKVHNIKVVMASLTPVCDCYDLKVTSRLKVPRILGLNRFLKEYAEKSNSVFLDYYSAMADGRAMKRELTIDGYLPSDAGYEVMAPLVEKAIRESLAKP